MHKTWVYSYESRNNSGVHRGQCTLFKSCAYVRSYQQRSGTRRGARPEQYIHSELWWKDKTTAMQYSAAGRDTQRSSYALAPEAFWLRVTHRARDAVADVPIGKGRLVGKPSAELPGLQHRGDSFEVQVSSLLQAAGIDLDAMARFERLGSMAMEAEHSCMRRAGVHLRIALHYLWRNGRLDYDVHVAQVYNGSRAMRRDRVGLPAVSRRRIVEMDHHGIGISFSQVGDKLEFSLVALISSLASSFMLTMVSGVLVDLVMLRFIRGKEELRDLTRPITKDFDAELDGFSHANKLSNHVLKVVWLRGRFSALVPQQGGDAWAKQLDLANLNCIANRKDS